MPGMKTETKRGLAAAGAALIALTILATLSPIPQLLMWYLTNNGTLSGEVASTVGTLYYGIAAPVIYSYLVYDVG